MTIFTRNLRQLIGTVCISALVLSSCVQETDIAIVDPEVKSAFDLELEIIFEAMESDPQLALDKLDNLILEAEAVDSRYYSGRAKWYKAYIYDEIVEDVSLAYNNYHEALKDILQTDDSSLKMMIYNNLGILYRFYGQYDAAIENYESALQLKGELALDELSNVYYNYGVALKLKGDSVSFFEAEQAFTRSLEYAKEVEYHENIASVYNQIGLMYKTIGDYDMARIAYDNTIRTYGKNAELSDKVGKAYHGIGVTYMDEGNTESSVRAFEMALEYKRFSGSIFITKYDLGTVLLRNGQIDDAISTWKNALDEKHDKNSVEQVQIYSDLTNALKSNNQFKEALSYSEIYNSSMQSILKEGESYKSKSDQVLFANVISDYEEFNKTTPFLARPLMILLTILVAVVLMYFVVALYYRSRSRRKVTEVVSKIQTEFLNIKVD
ncbi:MAG: tetratricopeptide repeat protein [Cyclobacteriaceae bacterium]